jgi:serine/threonine-protein kinase
MIELRLLGSVGLSMPDGTEARAILTQPKRLALLAYLAASSPGGFHRRDALLALFWPDFTERQARLSLRQALHHLRYALGTSVIANRGGDELELAPDALWCDAVAFRRALCSGELTTALELYRGDLLDAFSMRGISLELERWLEEERRSLRALAFGAASTLAGRAADEGKLAIGIQWARRAFALSAGDETALRRLVAMLDRYGDRAGALRTAEMFARRMREELDAEPSPETAALLVGIRTRVAARSSALSPVFTTGDSSAVTAQRESPSGAIAFPPATASAIPADGHLAGTERSQPLVRNRLRRMAAAGVASMILVVAIAAAAVRDRAARRAAPTIAVGWIEQWGGGDEQLMARLIPSLLETDLALLPCRCTLSGTRLHEVVDRMGSESATRGTVTSAARLAGATELLDGTLYHTSARTMRLDLRRVSLETGVVLRAYRVQGGTPFELASRAASLITSDLDPTAGAPPRQECSANGKGVERKQKAEGGERLVIPGYPCESGAPTYSHPRESEAHSNSHPRESGDPCSVWLTWIPASAGMTIGSARMTVCHSRPSPPR